MAGSPASGTRSESPVGWDAVAADGLACATWRVVGNGDPGALATDKRTGLAPAPSGLGAGTVGQGVAVGEVASPIGRKGRGGGIGDRSTADVDVDTAAGADCDWAAHGVPSTQKGSKAPIRNTAHRVCARMQSPHQ